ncbi:unnamed protein product, partial [Prorocentrum cordatum]
RAGEVEPAAGRGRRGPPLGLGAAARGGRGAARRAGRARRGDGPGRALVSGGQGEGCAAPDLALSPRRDVHRRRPALE